MGEPVEVVEGSDSEISRLFPKCRPRLNFPTTFLSEVTTNIQQGPGVTSASTTSDVNRNCVSDANDNYEVLPPTFEEDVTPQRDDSSGCDSSRMSVDSACATTSSTPASHSSSSSSSHASFATHNFPAVDKPAERNGADNDNDNDNDDLSVVSAYNDERFSSTVLDSSYEDSVGGRGVASPSISSSHKRAIVHTVPHNMSNLQSDAHMPSQPLSLLKREHFRLRDSRIETAGGKEMFSQSRSRPSRKRHEEGRRGHHPAHHFNHQPLIHHSHHHHHNTTMQQQKQSQQHISQIPSEYIRKVERSSSRSHSTNSNSSSSSNERRSSESKSESKDPAEDEREEVSPMRVGSEGATDGASTLVYETRLSGSSEVVFDDISEWVERGLTVRGVENSSLRGRIRRSSNCESQHFIATPVTPPTPPSRSERDSEYDEEDDEEEEEEEEEDEDSPMRVTRIGSVPIAEYEGSPRRYGQPIRPPRPGFPRRINNLSQDERARVLINSLEGDKKNSDPTLRNEKSHAHYKATAEYRKSKHRLTQLQQDKDESESSKSANFQDRNANGGSKESQQTLPQKSENESSEGRINLDHTQDNNSPVKISISTITSSYASSLSHNANVSKAGGATSSEQPSSECIPTTEVCEDYRFEDSETRKVLDEFFLESREKSQEFYDLEYTLKRQHGNSYVGQRLATTECDEGGDQQQGDENFSHHSNEEREEEIGEKTTESLVPEHSQNYLHQDNGTGEKINNINTTSENPQPTLVQENGNDHQENCEIGISRNFTLSPETTSCDSLDVESEFSVGDAEGSIPSSGKVVNTMPVLEDGLSSGEESEMELNNDQRLFPTDEHQAVMIRQQLFLDQHIQFYQPDGAHHLYQDNKNDEIEDSDKNDEIEDSEMERERGFQRTRSLDNQLCRGELPPLASSVSTLNQHHPTFSASLPVASLSPLSPSNAPNSPFSGSSVPHATSSPHASKPPLGKSPIEVTHHSPHTTLTTTHSPSSSTLTLMKKQISEIEREIALKKPEGVRKTGGEGECSLPPKLDLHLLDPLNKKVGEPPPPPAPHPHRGNNSNLENGSPHSTPPHTSSSSTSPSKVIGHLHSPQFTPVSAPIVAPQLLSSLGSLTSPGQVSPHMVPGHPATLELQHKPGNGVSPSRESVEAAIADIKQAIRRTKNLPLKSHPQEKQDRGPVWIPRNNRRDLPYTKRHSSPPSSQTQENSPQIHQHESSPSGGSNKSQERSLHEEDDGDTDQETDRLLGQQRSDDGFLDDKNWGRIRSKPVMPLSMAPNHKDVETEVSGINSNDSSPSTPSHHGSANITPSSPQDLLSSNKFLSKKEKEYGKKKGRSKEVMVHEPAVLIEGVLFRARYLGSTQLVSEGQPTKTTRMMQAEEAVSRIKAPEGEVQPSTEVDLFISTEKIMVLNTDLKEIMMDHALRTISYIADIGDLVVLMARRRVLPTDDQTDNPSQRIPKMICHVFESEEAQFIAQSIGQAFQVAYLEFLKANGIEDHSFVKEMDYQEVLNSQEIFGDELQMFAKKELQKEVVVPKMKGEILGVVVVESGWGSMVPTVVIANLSPTGAAAKCGQLNIGDQIIAINGISLVGLPLSNCQNYIKNTKYNTAVKLTVVPCPPVVEVKIRRPDTKYQLGFSVQNGVICSLLRGGIAERGGVRVGHRIIDINSQSVVAVPHEKIVNLLATSVGEIRMKTMPTSIFRLLTGQETPQYI